MRTRGSLTNDDEINDAAWVAARGAGVGAAKWAIFSGIAAGLGMAFSPLYRGTTIQFKVFLQTAGMILGSVIEADQRLIAHGKMMRMRKKEIRDTEVWRRYEEDYQIAKASSEKQDERYDS